MALNFSCFVSERLREPAGVRKIPEMIFEGRNKVYVAPKWTVCPRGSALELVLVLLYQMESQLTVRLYLSFPFVLCFSFQVISTRETYQ